MRIIDAQVHIWASGTPSGDHRQVPSSPWRNSSPRWTRPACDGAVIHPPVSWDPDANAICGGRRRATIRGRFAILGQVPLDTPADEPPAAGDLARPARAIGLRYALVRADQDWPIDGTMDWLWPAAEGLGLPVATMAWRFLPEFRAIAERHPRLSLIIDHCGLMRAREGRGRLRRHRSRDWRWRSCRTSR